MFKKIALLAGAGALVVGVAAPMAAADDSNIPTQCLNLKVDADNAARMLPDYQDAKNKAEANYQAASDLVDVKKGELKTQKGVAEKAHRKYITSKDSADKTIWDAEEAKVTKKEGEVSSALGAKESAKTTAEDKSSEYEHQKVTVKNAYDLLGACIYDANYTPKDGKCAAEFKAAKEAYAAMITAKNIFNTINNNKPGSDKTGVNNDAWKYVNGLYNADKAAASKQLSDATQKYAAAAALLQKCTGGKFAAPAPKAADKKAADNKVNNAAAKEGNGLAATGSVASVAGLLSALAVLAGGAFVGIRRFNS